MGKRKVVRSEWEEVKELAEANLYTFAKLVSPERLYGDIHKDVFDFLQNSEHPNDLLLLPRAHMKSHCVAVWAAWYITNNPDTTILYISATSGLAEKQLYAIKNILTSDRYRLYWPEMVNDDEGKREKWNNTAICIDHPQRKAEGVRDDTVCAAGITTNTTGLHADVIIADDVVVPDNAYTEEGRRKVAAAMSQMASILNTGGVIKACGTRYHPADQYSLWKDQEMDVFDDNGDLIDKKPIWNIFERVVEVNGRFIWPRSVRDDGKAFGFDWKELNRIKSMYTDRTQFFAQYYNDPNDPDSQRISSDKFQYYDQKFITNKEGSWYYKDNKLNIVAAIDFAYTLSKKADYSAIVVIGIDAEGRIYVLDIDRFKTDKITTYYDHILQAHHRWGFKKLRAEVTAAQSVVVGDIKDKIRETGAFISIDSHSPTRHTGSKEERMASVLEPRYNDMSVYHFKGGHIPALEEELVLARPKHDDIKDCLASAIQIATPPRRSRSSANDGMPSNVIYNKRFGGVAFR